MFPASNTSGGKVMSPGPLDVCKVPAPPAPFVPGPFPNMVMVEQATPSTCSKKVKIKNKETVTQDSEVPMSSGDEPGTLGGMISSQFKGPAKFKKGSSKVKAEGKPVCSLLSIAAQNGNNANFPPGMQVAPSQTKVKVMP